MSILHDKTLSNLVITDILVVRGKIVTPLVESKLVVETDGEVISNVDVPKVQATQELVVGTGNSACTIISGLTSPHTYTLPEVGANADFVMTEGDQTVNGLKAFTNLAIDTGAAQGSIASALTSPITFTLPDAGANCNFVVTEGAQTINALKTFNAGVRFLTSGGLVTTLNYYEENSINPATFTSTTFLGNANSAVRLTKIGNFVTIGIATFQQAPNGAADDTIQTADGLVPARFRPLSVKRAVVPIFATSIGLTSNGLLEIGTTGRLRFYKYDPTTNQNGNYLITDAQVGWDGVTLTYNIA